MEINYILLIGAVLLVVVLFIKISNKCKKNESPCSKPKKAIQRVNLGSINIFYGSQTGRGASFAHEFSDGILEQGFTGNVIDLKDFSLKHFQENQISVFFISNTGEGQPPENAVRFMDILTGDGKIDGEMPNWKNLNYAVFGLGDSQYEFFNRTGVRADKALEEKGANRLLKLRKGDTAISIEDDFEEWKAEILPILTQFRKTHSFESKSSSMSADMKQQKEAKHNRNYLMEQISSNLPIYANYKFTIHQLLEPSAIKEDEFDYKTKASLLGKLSKINQIVERRQTKSNGSSLELEIQLEGQPEYQTAGNIALWPVNDPEIVEQVLKYFKLKPETIVDVSKINPLKKLNLNFVVPTTIKKLLEQSIDLQSKVTKASLKKLGKFQSKGVQYFNDNSSTNTTEEFKRITEKEFCFMFQLIEKFQVELTFEDFVELSEAMNPRLFTIASSYKFQKNIAVVASIVKNGLISKHFNRNPKQIKAELRKSSFADIMKWKKVIFIGAGTGFAPFRGFLQEAELEKKQGKPIPIISLYFGCKYSDCDFIYREEIYKWKEMGVIQKLNLAFSRETEKKVYVQTLLQQNKEEVFEFINDPETAAYACGSLKMGKSVGEVVQEVIVSSGKSQQEAEKMLEEWSSSGKIVKELWEAGA